MTRPPVTYGDVRERMGCCMPFCRRTVSRDKGYKEWLCPNHWRMVPKRLKWLKRRVEARARKNPTPYNQQWADRIWQKCKESVTP